MAERISDYDYDLPPERIAQTPLLDRADARLLYLSRASGEVEHRQFRQCVDFLAPGDLLVLNDTRVSAIRLFGHRPSGGAVEALLLREVSPFTFEALVRPGKRLTLGHTIFFGDDLRCEVVDIHEDGRRTLRFFPEEGLMDRLAAKGFAPLPPYIHAPLADRERYQTIYSRHPGSSAAPTAGLHFTDEVLDRLQAKGVETTTVTLHVGLDTFRPVTVEDPARHPIHGETCQLGPEAAEKIHRCAGRIVAVGTTSVRTLETFAVGPRQVRTGHEVSSLFIRPGFNFQVIDGMFTNFHMPQTTMLMMLAALAGRENVMNAYQAAIAEEYRFLSFGDSMLIL